MTAACLHYRVTGKRALLDSAVKLSDFLCEAFAHPTPELARFDICPSHYMGIIEMYRTTGNPKYLDLGKKFIDMRDMVENGTDQNQERVPFRQETKALGHAVRANYLYAGVGDVYAESGDKATRPSRRTPFPPGFGSFEIMDPPKWNSGQLDRVRAAFAMRLALHQCAAIFARKHTVRFPAFRPTLACLVHNPRRIAVREVRQGLRVVKSRRNQRKSSAIKMFE